MTNGRQKPPCRCFYDHMEGGSQVRGEYQNGEVLAHSEIADSNNELLRVVVLEEIVHHCTGAGDLSRDLQQFAFRYATKLADFIRS